MIRILCAVTLLATTSCAQLAATAPSVVTEVAQIASAGLAAYQAAMGAAEQAEANNPAIQADIQAVAAKAAPYVADAQTATAQASTAPALADLSAELLLDAAPHIVVTSNGK